VSSSRSRALVAGACTLGLFSLLALDAGCFGPAQKTPAAPGPAASPADSGVTIVDGGAPPKDAIASPADNGVADVAGPKPPSPDEGVAAVTVAPPPPPRVSDGTVEGRPKGLKAQAPALYWLWHDKKGWHLYSTSARKERRFSGSVTALDGPITAFRPTTLDWKDRVKVDGAKIAWDFPNRGRADGFQWTMASRCARFELRIEGELKRTRVRIGRGAQNPRQALFEACLEPAAR
jgi:hypothetical protein